MSELSRRTSPDEVQWALGTSDVSLRHLGVSGRGLKRRVTQQLLDDANVLAHLEEVRGEAVRQGMGCDALGEVALGYDVVQYALDCAGRDGTPRDGSGE